MPTHLPNPCPHTTHSYRRTSLSCPQGAYCRAHGAAEFQAPGGCKEESSHYKPTRWTRHSYSGRQATPCCPNSAPWACKTASWSVAGWAGCRNQTGLCSHEDGGRNCVGAGRGEKPWQAHMHVRMPPTHSVVAMPVTLHLYVSGKHG